jgi:two-component system, cell cycle sensor histidine kinase and response regulator CckA
VTDRRHHRGVAAQSASLLEQLLGEIPAAVWAVDDDLVIQAAAGSLLGVFQVPAADLVGRGVGDFFRGFGVELPAASAHRRALSGDAIRFEFESNRRLYEARVEAVRDGGRVVGAIGMAIDVSDSRDMQDQLRAAQRMESIGRLAGRIAHDFNNVLSVIESYGALLANDLTDARAKEDVEVIRRAARKAADLVSQLLAFSRKQVRQPEVIDLNVIVGDLEKVLHRVIGEDALLVTRREEGLGSVVADRGQIEQVVMNLVVNARDALLHNGVITIETRNEYLDEAYCARHLAGAPGPHVMLSVSDNGCGMDRETQTRVFEPFFTTKPPGKGSGLGLSTVYGIVKQNNGYISLESEVGKGSSFKIYLPRVDELPAARDVSRPVSNIGGNETILLVEDDDALRSATRRILRGRGYTILEARHGGEALLLCERYAGDIQLLLTDVDMPQMSGRELCQKLQQSRPEMKVLFMSGFSDATTGERELIEAGEVFLSKPFSPTSLLDTIRKAIERS